MINLLSQKPAKRIIIVNRDFQVRYTIMAVIVGTISTALTAFILLYPLYVFEILRVPKFLPLPILLTMVLAIFINIANVAFFGLYVTHRIVGPLYALTRGLRRVELGGWAGHLKVRQLDELKYLIRSFNEMVDGLMRQADEDLQLIAELEAIQGLNEDAIEKLRVLRQRIEQRKHEQKIEGKLIN